MPPKRLNKARERKSLLNIGEKYINTSGKMVAARSLGADCNLSTCGRRCKDNVSDDQNLVVLKVFGRA